MLSNSLLTRTSNFRQSQRRTRRTRVTVLLTRTFCCHSSYGLFSPENPSYNIQERSITNVLWSNIIPTNSHGFPALGFPVRNLLRIFQVSHAPNRSQLDCCGRALAVSIELWSVRKAMSLLITVSYEPDGSPSLRDRKLEMKVCCISKDPTCKWADGREGGRCCLLCSWTS